MSAELLCLYDEEHKNILNMVKAKHGDKPFVCGCKIHVKDRERRGVIVPKDTMVVVFSRHSNDTPPEQVAKDQRRLSALSDESWD